MKSKNPKETKGISDDMIGNADRICSCASTVVDMIISKNEGKHKKTSLKKIVESLEKKNQIKR